MNASPLDHDTLVTIFLGQSPDTAPPIPWSDEGARSRFASQVARSYPHLLCMGALRNKKFFCEETARLVLEGLTPNITDGTRRAFSGVNQLFTRFGLTAVGKNIQAEFQERACPNAPVVELAAFLDKHCRDSAPPPTAGAQGPHLQRG